MNLIGWFTLPSQLKSPVDYLIEMAGIDYLQNLPHFPRVYITPSGLLRMACDPFLSYVEYDELSIWTDEEITIKGKFYPELKYVLDGNNVIWIKYGKEEVYFNPSGKEVIGIDYRP